MKEDYPYLGRGWSFPPAFDRSRGEVEIASGFEDINQSLEIILTTRLGERLMQPKFGCSMKDMVFDAINSGAIGLLQNMIETAILYFEPRIDVEKIDLNFEDTAGRLLIEIHYKVRNANSRFNFVFPYYLDEANTRL
ncbi:MAG: GPW/gp25 family protein [Lewinellaceae bacterium]|nr:GPW/gp25 family protein [Lewinellaceae bacterium]